jgi:hypothetical protein
MDGCQDHRESSAGRSVAGEGWRVSSKRRTLRRHYVAIDQLVYQSEAFRTLPASALKLWVDLRVQFRGDFNNGNLSVTLGSPVLRERGWNSNDVLRRALAELIDRGLLKRARVGKRGPGRICSLYAFTDCPVAKNERLFIAGSQASNEFLQWTCAHTKKKSVGRKAVHDWAGIRPSVRPESGPNKHARAPESGTQMPAPNSAENRTSAESRPIPAMANS